MVSEISDDATSKLQSLRFDRARLDRIGDWMARYVAQGKYAGSSVLIARGGHEVYHHATGLRDIETGLPFERDTIVRIYSMTKPVTAVAVMMLFEQGLFSLDAPVSEFIPAFRDMQALIPGAERIDQLEPCPVPTLHQLLTHTSGLSYAFNAGVLPQAMAKAGIGFDGGSTPLAEMVGRVAALPLAFKPGARWEYSVASDVLGRVVEQVSGTALDRFFHDKIFAPLGMIETGFSVPETDLRRFATLYASHPDTALSLKPAPTGVPILRTIDSAGDSCFRNPAGFSGGGGLVSTLEDYMRFCEMLRRGGEGPQGQLLSPQTVAFMMRNHLAGDIASMGPTSFAEQPMQGVGFGLAGAVVLDPARARAPGSIGDFGWGGMASTVFWIDHVLDLSVVFLTQLAPSSSYSSRAELKALVHGAFVDGNFDRGGFEQDSFEVGAPVSGAGML